MMEGPSPRGEGAAGWQALAPDTVAYVLETARRAAEHQILRIMSADNRSSQMSAVIMAMSLGLLGLAGTLWSGAYPRIAIGFLAASGFALASAVLAAYAARPVRLAPYAGAPHAFLGDDPALHAPLETLRAAEIATIRAAYDQNDAIAARKERLFNRALVLLMLGPVAFALGWWLGWPIVPAG